MDLILPYKVGDLTESRTFDPGFRGAWFRSIIRDMCVRQGHFECLLEYVDFPDEKKTWTRLYKVPPELRRKKSSNSRVIMIRPTFPQWYWENEVPEELPKTDVIAVVTSPWKVGDLIEWWYTECYWSGKIIELLDDDKLKIALHEPPIGEGGCYDADSKDLRPALDWSLERGWTVPLSQEGEKCWRTARLITQKTDSGSSSSDEENEPSSDREERIQKCLNVPSDTPTSVSHPANSNSEVLMNNRDGKEETRNCSSVMSQEVTNSNVDLPPNQTGECSTSVGTDCPSAEGSEFSEGLLDAEPSPVNLEKRKISIEPTSMEASTVAIDDNNTMELEKVAKKIRWLENILLSLGSASAQINATKPSLKVPDKEASAKQK